MKISSFNDQTVLLRPSRVTIGSLPSELIFKIFTYLDHRSLINCEKVSRFWKEVAKDDRLYMRFAKTFNFFSRGKEQFVGCTKIKFLDHFKWFEEGIEVINSILPDDTMFNPLYNNSVNDQFLDFASFNYESHKTALHVFLHLGGTPLKPYYLGCYFGDEEMVQLACNRANFDAYTLLNGLNFSVINNKLVIMAYLKEKCSQIGVYVNHPMIVGFDWANFLSSLTNNKELKALLKGQQFPLEKS